ncbi:MAG: hypothetical protein DRP49_00685 [Spirochaetes bacterium]|nr:MAG: hypothetical protein DRP49_00685 [Spirochaetota bacterium]
MKYSPLKELQISRIGLGAVQFGIDYGINNSTGQVSYEDILQILSFAHDKGVNFIDTSRYYGSSEENLGRALKELNLVDAFTVCTKLDLPKNYVELPEKALLQTASDCLEKSSEMLGLETLPVYLLHTYDYKKHLDGILWDFLVEKKQNGAIGHLGVSIANGPQEALESLEDPDVDVIQIPYNLFDHRWHKEGILEKAVEKGVAVFNRSTYLQGLLVMGKEKAAEKLPSAVPYLERLKGFVDKKGLNKKELIASYVFSEPSITSTVVGVDSLKQLKENIILYGSGLIEEDTRRSLESMFSDVPDSIVNPSLWDNKK